MRLILLSALILFGLGTTLYQVKTSIDDRQRNLHNLEFQISKTKRNIAVLEAEWAYISRPDRVMKLSNDLLQMSPIGRDRILELDSIPMRIDTGEASLKKVSFSLEKQGLMKKVSE